MSSDFERLLREGRKALPEPSEAVTRRARLRALAAVRRRRSLRIRVRDHLTLIRIRERLRLRGLLLKRRRLMAGRHVRSVRCARRIGAMRGGYARNRNCGAGGRTREALERLRLSASGRGRGASARALPRWSRFTHAPDFTPGTIRAPCRSNAQVARRLRTSRNRARAGRARPSPKIRVLLRPIR